MRCLDSNLWPSDSPIFQNGRRTLLLIRPPRLVYVALELWQYIVGHHCSGWSFKRETTVLDNYKLSIFILKKKYGRNSKPMDYAKWMVTFWIVPIFNLIFFCGFLFLQLQHDRTLEHKFYPCRRSGVRFSAESNQWLIKLYLLLPSLAIGINRIGHILVSSVSG